MKKFLLTIFLFAFATTSMASSYMLMPIDEVHDGDTIKTHFSTYKLPEPLNQVSIRLYGIDTPEMPAPSYKETGKLGRAKCIKEAELALAARDAVIALVGDTKTMQVIDFEWGKFGGRIVAKVKVHGVDVSQYLIDKGMAVPYFGGAKTKDWCA